MKEDRSPGGGAVSVGWGRRPKPGSWSPQWAFKEEQVSLVGQVIELCLCVWRSLLLHLPWNLHWNPRYLLRGKCFVSEDWQLQDAGFKAGMHTRAKVTHCSLAKPTLFPPYVHRAADTERARLPSMFPFILTTSKPETYHYPDLGRPRDLPQAHRWPGPDARTSLPMQSLLPYCTVVLMEAIEILIDGADGHLKSPIKV